MGAPRPPAHGASAPPGEGAALRRALLRDPLAWQVTLFMGLQSLHFYAVAAWIPTIFLDAGRSPAEAGLLLSLAGAVGLVFSATVPSLAARRRRQSGLVAVVCAFYMAGYAGLILAPGTLSALWMVLCAPGLRPCPPTSATNTPPG